MRGPLLYVDDEEFLREYEPAAGRDAMIENVYQLIQESSKAKAGASVAVSTRVGQPYYSVPVRDVVITPNGTLMIIVDSVEPPAETRSEEIP